MTRKLRVTCMLVSAAVLLSCAVATLLAQGSAQTPAQGQGQFEWKDGQWVPAAPPAKGTPAGELALIRSLLEHKQPRAALRAADAFLASYPTDPGCEEAMVLAGQAELDRGRYGQAYDKFEAQLARYKSGAFFERVLLREYDVAEAFLAGKKKIVMGFLRVSAQEDALDILERIAVHAPRTQLAEKALLRIGEYHLQDGQYAKAVDAYDHYLQTFAKSAEAPQAMLRAARASLAAYQGSRYDETPLIEADQRFRLIAEQYPDVADKARVQAILEQITAAKAQQAYETAKFYERTGHSDSAAVYYRTVVDKYPDSNWAQESKMALVRLGQAAPAEQPSAATPATQPAGEPTTQEGGQP